MEGQKKSAERRRQKKTCRPRQHKGAKWTVQDLEGRKPKTEFRPGRGRRRRTRQLRRLAQAPGGSGERPSSLSPPPTRTISRTPLPGRTILGPVRNGASRLHPAPNSTRGTYLLNNKKLNRKTLDVQGVVEEVLNENHIDPIRNNAPGRRAFWVELPGPGAIVAAGGRLFRRRCGPRSRRRCLISAATRNAGDS